MNDRETVTTPAIQAAAALGLAASVVTYTRARSVNEGAEKQGISPRQILKTLVVRLSADEYRFVLVPGDSEMDWSKLRRHLGVRRTALPDAAEAKRVTGYEPGTITPFGATTAWPVVADAVVPTLPLASIGAGRHGTALHAPGDAIVAALGAEVVDITKAV